MRAIPSFIWWLWQSGWWLHSDHSRDELLRLIAERHGQKGAVLEFRLVFVMRDGSELIRETIYESDAVKVAEARA